MSKYEPMSRETHLARGTCCLNGCVFCPWRAAPIFKQDPVDPRIEAALRSGEPTIIYSDRMSLVPTCVLQNLTIVYKPYLQSWHSPLG